MSLMPEGVSSGAYVARVLPQQTPDPTAQATVPAQTGTAQTPATGETTPVVPVAPETTGQDRDTVLTVLWAAGGLACPAWGVLSYLRLRRRIADAVLVRGNIYETDQIDSPFVCGFFRPRIYLPVGLEEPDRRYVLLHEQAHIRRRDYLTKLLAYLALCVHWFNPVLWLSYHLFGRDVEAATDQSVIRSFDRMDTAGYAAALLHLGHKPSLPQAFPLAFGEENPKHRIRAVLSYKKPAFWVVLAAVVCAVLGVLLLADRRAPEEILLDGQPVRQAAMLDVLTVTDYVGSDLPITELPLLVPLSDELTHEITALIDQADQSAETTVSTLPDPPEKTLVFSTSAGEMYQLRQEDGAFFLCRADLDGPWQKRRVNWTEAEQTAYLTWQSAADAYLSVGRADDLYQLRTPYLGNHVAVANILEALQLGEVLGHYTIELQTSQEPYGVILHLDQDLTSETERRYLREMSFLILALIDNVGSVSYTTPSEPTPQDAIGVSTDDDPNLDRPDQETFWLLYATHFGNLAIWCPASPDGLDWWF